VKRPESEKYVLAREGDVIADRFRVHQLVGTGGMGSVWVARELGSDRDVVIKFHEVGFTGRDGDRSLKRFLREARVLESVDHPNACRLIVSGQDERSGEPYLVLERLHGDTLLSHLRRLGVFPVANAFSIAREVALGLDAVHAVGILHRDVKPDNVFLHRVDEALVPKLIDFGLARPIAGGAPITAANVAVGTPGFMAPEQARGRQDVDERIDVYGLGVTLYQMLTGDLPFEGRSAMELMIEAARGEPISPRVRRPALSRLVEEIVMTAIARDRDERFEDARAFAAALRAVSDHGVGSA